MNRSIFNRTPNNKKTLKSLKELEQHLRNQQSQQSQQPQQSQQNQQLQQSQQSRQSQQSNTGRFFNRKSREIPTNSLQELQEYLQSQQRQQSQLSQQSQQSQQSHLASSYNTHLSNILLPSQLSDLKDDLGIDEIKNLLEQLALIEEQEEEKAAAIRANEKLLSIITPKTDPSKDPDVILWIHINNILKFLNRKSDKDLFKILDKYNLNWMELNNQRVQSQIIEYRDSDREFSLNPYVRARLIIFIREKLIREIRNIRNILLRKGWRYDTLSQIKSDDELSITGGRKKTYKRKTQIRRRTRKTTKNLRKRKRKRIRKTIRKNR